MSEDKHRNLFQIDNARDLTRRELVETFVITFDFKRLLSPKNHIMLGERGSGKTALAKMLSHDHLSLLQEGYAKEIIDNKLFIGMYVSIKTEWVSGLKNKPWQDEREKETFFQWRLNVATCVAFLKTLRSCLDTYVDDFQERILVERKIIEGVSKSWSEGTYITSAILDLQRYLEDIEHIRQQQIARKRATGRLRVDEDPAGIAFETELFQPLRRGITLASRELNLPEECKWLLCLDEAEALDEIHHRILNTYLRADSGNLVFKITTTPYSHYTQDTNSGAPLTYGDDYEYVYIDQDSIFQVEELVRRLFEKRARLSATEYQNITLEELLGRSKLMMPKESAWPEDSEEMGLLEKYANKKTFERAKRLLQKDSTRFQNEIARKFHGALLLRQAVEELQGHTKLDVYSGLEMAIRCGDSNPRRLVRIFNSFLMSLKKYGYNRNQRPLISPKNQTDILIDFSTNTLERTKTLPKCGPLLFTYLDAIGTYMHNYLHNVDLSSNLILAIDIDKNISERDWQVIERAVEWGYLFPIRNTNNPDHLPKREGQFHLAYVLAPHFKILPRKGESRNLSTMLRHKPLSGKSEDKGTPLFDHLIEEEDLI